MIFTAETLKFETEVLVGHVAAEMSDAIDKMQQLAKIIEFIFGMVAF